MKNIKVTLAGLDIDCGYVGLFLVVKYHEYFKFNGHIHWGRCLFYFQWKEKIILDIFFIHLIK